MKSSEISSIISKFKGGSSPYRCILISGDWGIGKTYEIKKSCKADIYISLFGLSRVDDIYKAILTNLPDNKKWSKSLREIASKAYFIVNKLGDNKLGFNIGDFLSLKELVIKNADKLSGRIIIFDDFERISKSLNIEDIFGVFDALLSTNETKIILVANEEEIANAEDFNKYQEKVVDHTYVIDKLSYEITKGNDKYDEDFVSSFMQAHNFKNLRTLQRAQRFYEDVCNELKPYLSNDDFNKQIRKICYAVVFEVTEKTYSEKVKAEIEELEANKLLTNDVSNAILWVMDKDELSLIDKNYISGSVFEASSRELIYTIIEYYKNGTEIDEDIIKSKHSIYVQGYQKHYFYKSQEEIKELIMLTECEIYESNLSAIELIDKANLICIWKDIIGEEISDDFFTFISNKFFDFYSNEFNFSPDEEESFIIARNSHYSEFVESATIKKLLKEVFAKIESHYFDLFIEKLRGAIQNKDYVECDNLSKLLKTYYDHFGYRELITSLTANILDEVFAESFALCGSIEEKHYSCYRRLMESCYKLDKERTTKFLDTIIRNNPDDFMLKHRIKLLREKFEGPLN